MTYLNMTTVLQVELSLSSAGECTCFCSSGKLESTLKSTSPELAQPWEDKHGRTCCKQLREKCSWFSGNTVNGVAGNLCLAKDHGRGKRRPDKSVVTWFPPYSLICWRVDKKERNPLTYIHTAHINFSLHTTVNLQNISILKYSGTMNYCSNNFIEFGLYNSYQVTCLIFFNQPVNVFAVPWYVMC